MSGDTALSEGHRLVREIGRYVDKSVVAEFNESTQKFEFRTDEGSLLSSFSLDAVRAGRSKYQGLQKITWRVAEQINANLRAIRRRSRERRKARKAAGQ